VIVDSWNNFTDNENEREFQKAIVDAHSKELGIELEGVEYLYQQENLRPISPPKRIEESKFDSELPKFQSMINQPRNNTSVQADNYMERERRLQDERLAQEQEDRIKREKKRLEDEKRRAEEQRLQIEDERRYRQGQRQQEDDERAKRLLMEKMGQASFLDEIKRNDELRRKEREENLAKKQSEFQSKMDLIKRERSQRLQEEENLAALRKRELEELKQGKANGGRLAGIEGKQNQIVANLIRQVENTEGDLIAEKKRSVMLAEGVSKMSKEVSDLEVEKEQLVQLASDLNEEGEHLQNEVSNLKAKKEQLLQKLEKRRTELKELRAVPLSTITDHKKNEIEDQITGLEKISAMKKEELSRNQAIYEKLEKEYNDFVMKKEGKNRETALKSQAIDKSFDRSMVSDVRSNFDRNSVLHPSRLRHAPAPVQTLGVQGEGSKFLTDFNREIDQLIGHKGSAFS
jgi:hypothetical protein